MISKETKKIIINNHFYIPYEKFNDIFSFNSLLLYNQKQINSFNNNLNIKENPKINNNSINNFKENKLINNEIDDKKENNYILEKNKVIPQELENRQKIKLSKKFFKIDFIRKKGRKPKSSSTKSLHTKFSRDNILRKIKVKFFHKIVKYLNKIIISKYIKKVNILKLLNGKISQNNNINFNKKLLNSKLKDIFSLYEINGKFKLSGKYYNKEIINKIYEQNIIEIMNILEMTFLEVFKIFRDLDSQKLNGLEKIDSVIKEIKMKENNEEYIKKFKKIVLNFENYYLDKKVKD